MQLLPTKFWSVVWELDFVGLSALIGPCTHLSLFYFQFYLVDVVVAVVFGFIIVVTFLAIEVLGRVFVLS